MPVSCYHLWKMFLDLNAARSSNGFGSNPLAYQEIYAYCQLYDIQLDEWELDVLRKFDNVVMEISAKQAEKERQKNASKK
jgi:hypothetical protein